MLAQFCDHLILVHLVILSSHSLPDWQPSKIIVSSRPISYWEDVKPDGLFLACLAVKWLTASQRADSSRALLPFNAAPSTTAGDMAASRAHFTLVLRGAPAGPAE